MALRARVTAAPADEVSQLDLVAHLLGHRRPHEALAAARAALPWLRGSTPIQLALGEALARVGLHEESMASLRRVRASGTEAALLFAEAGILAGKRDEAVRALAKLSVREPESAIRIARLYARAGTPLRAEKVLQQALQAAPEHSTLRGALSTVLLQAGRYKEAERLWARAPKLPETADERYEAGTAKLLGGGAPEAARALLKEAVDSAPRNVVYRFAYALALLRVNQPAAAGEELQFASTAPGAPSEVFRELARVKEKLGQPREARIARSRYLRELGDPRAAVEALEADMASSKSSPEYAAAVAVALSDCGNASEALRLLAPWRDDPARTPEVLWEIYLAQRFESLYENALATLESLARSGANEIDVLDARSDTLQSLRRYDEARGILEELQRRAPGDATRAYTLGLFYVVLSDDPNGEEKAEQYLRTAIRLNPMLESPRFRLGVLYLRQGKLPEAIDQLRRSLGLSPSKAASLRALAQAYSRTDQKALADETFRIYRRERDLEERRKALLLPDRSGQTPVANHLSLADLELKAHRNSEALRHLETADHFLPLSQERRNQLITLYGLEQRYFRQAEYRSAAAR
jgi:predicted Zn-dependent protease